MSEPFLTGWLWLLNGDAFQFTALCQPCHASVLDYLVGLTQFDVIRNLRIPILMVITNQLGLHPSSEMYVDSSIRQNVSSPLSSKLH